LLPAGTALFTKQRRASPDDGLITQSIRAAAPQVFFSVLWRNQPTLQGRYDEEQQMASERSTDVQAFIGELDGGVFETKIGAVLSEVASGVMNTKTKGKVSLNLEIEPFDENRVKIKHKLSYVRPTNRGEISEEDTTETPMYVNRGGRLTILQEDQGQLLTLAGEPDGKLRAAGH
jgi:hypothetical protein